MAALVPGAWNGPLYSGLGGHLVQVSERVDARLPELAEVRAQVEREYLAQRRQQAKRGAGVDRDVLAQLGQRARFAIAQGGQDAERSIDRSHRVSFFLQRLRCHIFGP